MSHIISPFYTWPTVFTGKLPLKDKLGILQLKPLFKSWWNHRNWKFCQKNNLNHSILSETILKQGFNCKILNLSFKRSCEKDLFKITGKSLQALGNYQLPITNPSTGSWSLADAAILQQNFTCVSISLDSHSFWRPFESE